MESGAVAGYYIDNNKVTHGFLWAPVRERKKCWLDRRSWVWELQERHGRSFREGEHRPHVVPANVLAVSDHPSHLVSVGQADFVTSVGGKCIHPSLRPRRFLQSFGALRTPELAEYSILCPQTGIRPRQGQPDCNRLGPLKQRRFQRRFDSITYPRTPSSVVQLHVFVAARSVCSIVSHDSEAGPRQATSGTPVLVPEFDPRRHFGCLCMNPMFVTVPQVL
jgi:hypothetical protein